MTLKAYLFVGVSLAFVAAAGCGSEASMFEDPAGDAGSGMASGSFGGTSSGDASSCKATVTCASAGAECGKLPDDCGAILECGSCTKPGEICGGGGPSKCGPGTPSSCVKLTCADQAASCGPVGDGCGGIVQCGTCTNPGETCGGGGPSKCGVTDGGACARRTCADALANCGFIADGCGDLVDCGSCTTAGESCGAGGFPNVCGGPTCRKRTCEEAGATCGPVADGCGGLLSCGECIAPETCGAVVPSRCGKSDTTGPACTGLCQQQVKCEGAVTTTLTGKVLTPNGTLPIANALVYVPNGPVLALPSTVECERCGTEVSGAPLVSDTSKPDGSFVLKNVPVGVDIPVVIQVGRWRRQVTVAKIDPCVDNAAPDTLMRLPKNHTEGDIPRTAIVTGQLDAMECVFHKIGIEPSEVTDPDGSGRMHIYFADGAIKDVGTLLWTPDRLFGRDGIPPILPAVPSRLDNYDQVILDCQGAEFRKPAAWRDRVKAYADAGGRLFLSHYAYVWLFQTTPWNTSAVFNPGQGDINPATGYINTSFPKGATMADWLANVDALVPGDPARIAIEDAKHDVDAPLTSPAQLWIDTKAPQTVSVQNFTFNTPFEAAPANQCGRVVYSNFHVLAENNLKVIYPTHCKGPLTAQEKVLAYMLFDLASCITPDAPPAVPTCSKKSCTELGVKCGQSGDGCGGVQTCTACPDGQTCGGGGVPNECGAPTCTATGCSAVGADCGDIGNGCGGSTNCGKCPDGQTCGAAGPNKCGTGTCTKRTCDQAGGCGQVADGCGGLLTCGCPDGQTCGGGGVTNQCGAPSCTPLTCQEAGANCGTIANGCGAVTDCGNCGPGLTCGGGGTPNVCGNPYVVK